MTSTNEPSRISNLGESAYLSVQAANAKDAMAEVLKEMKGQLRAGLDVKVWTREYPLILTGAAAVAGFVAASAMVKSKEQKALARLAAIERAMFPQAVAVGPEGKRSEAAGTKASRPSVVESLLHQLVTAVKPALMSALAAGISAKVAQPDAGEGSQQQQASASQATGTATGFAVAHAAHEDQTDPGPQK